MAISLGSVDVIVLVVLGLFVLAKGVFYAYKSTFGQSRDLMHEPSQFFLAGRSMEWWTIGLSIFATNIGTEHFVGQAGAAASSGMPVAIYEWTAGLLIFFLGWGLAPMYLGLDLMTVPEWFERRFNKWCRLLLAVISVIAYVITKIAASLFAGAVLFDVILEVDMWKSVPVLLVFTAFYSAAGGLKAIMYTDASQAIIFIVGGIVGSAVALAKIGGVSGLLGTLHDSGLDYFTHTLRPMRDIDYPWLGMLVGQPLASIWYWCIDQEMVQRVLAAKSISHAQGGCTVAGYLKILPPFMMVFPGMIARAFFERCRLGQGYEEWCDVDLSNKDEANKAYPLLIARMFPDGVRGLMIASMVLAMMSSLDSVFNCVSTIFTVDIYQRFIDPRASNQRLVWVGRGVTIVAAFFGIVWLPVIHHNQAGLYLATQNALTHLSPTIVSIFILGVVWPRANWQGALAGMFVGFSFGILRFVTNFWADCPDGSGDTFECMNFNHMALIIFAMTTATAVMVSGWTKLPDDENLWGTCLYAPDAARKARASDPQAMEEQTTRLRDAFKVNPEISKFLQAIGSMLLAVMLSLCVGFGYTSQHRQNQGTEETALVVSGGMLAILCNIGAATFLIVWFGLQMWYRRGLLNEQFEMVEHNPFSVQEDKLSDQSKRPDHRHRGSRQEVESMNPGSGAGHLSEGGHHHSLGDAIQKALQPAEAAAEGIWHHVTERALGAPKKTTENREAQTDLMAKDLKNSIVYGQDGTRFSFNNNFKEEELDQWSVGSDQELEPPRRPAVIQKPISHVHRDLPVV